MDANVITAKFKNKIQQAINHPYVWPEIEQLQDQEQLIAQKYLYGNLKKKAFERKLAKIQAEVPSLILTSLVELEVVLELLNVSGDIKNATLQDMNFKYERAVKQGYQCRFSIWFYRAVNRGLAMYCAQQIKVC